MDIKKNRNDKITDIITQEATEKYAQDIGNNEFECYMTSEFY